MIENVAAGTATGERPARGSSMARVEARFGAPATRSGPVGQPPISRWDYPDFVVFFEHDHVVHAVAHHRRADRTRGTRPRTGGIVDPRTKPFRHRPDRFGIRRGGSRRGRGGKRWRGKATAAPGKWRHSINFRRQVETQPDPYRARSSRPGAGRHPDRQRHRRG